MGEADPAQAPGEGAEEIQQEIDDGDDQGMEDEGIKPGQEGDRVEEVDQRDTGQRRGDDQDEENIFPPAQARHPPSAPDVCVFRKRRKSKPSMAGAQRTDIGAEEPPDDQRRPDRESATRGRGR